MRPRLTSYGLAVISVGVTLVVKLLLDPMIGRDAPFLLFFAPVMISAWHGGMGPGLAATILAALVSDFFFIPPFRAVLSGHRETLLHVTVFALESVFITVLCAGLRRARQRAETSARNARTLEAERSRLLEVETAARGRAAFVAEASRVLAGSLDDETTLKGLASLAVPAFADACVADLLDDAGTITRVIAVHRDPSQSQHALALLRHPTDALDSHPLLTVLRTGRPELYAELSPAVRQVLAGTTEPSLPGGGCHVESAMIVPLVARGRTLGALSFVSERAQRRYGAAELAVAEDVARRAALAVDHARLYREAQEARRRFQDLVQSLQEVVWEADAETFQFTFVSRHAEVLLRYPLEQWLERDFLGRLVHPDDRARVMADRESARRAGRGHDLEYRALAADGQPIWVRDIGKIVPDTEGAGRRVRGVMVDVTARKRGEEALSQVASIVESSGDAILGTTVDGTILTWNTGAERLYGYRASEVVGRSLALLVPPDRPDEVGRLSERLRHGEYIVGLETVRVARDGRRLDVALTLSPVRDASGAMVGVSAIGRDITDRKRTERRLGAQYAVSRVLAESATLADAAPRVLREVGGGLGLTVGALWIVDADAGLLRCAETWYAGSPPTTEFEPLIRQTTFAPGVGVPGRAWLARAPVWVADVTQEPDLPAALGAARADLQTAFAFPVRGNSGVLGVVDFFSREIRTPDPDLILMVGAVGHQLGQFIERRKAELAVRESEALKGAMLEMSVDGIITIDHKGKVVEFNPAAERIFGYPRSEALGRELAELIVPPGLREQYRASFAHSLATGEGQVIGQQSEMMAVRADGSEFPVELAIIRIPLPFPRPPVFTGYVRDIAERKRAEAAERSAEALRSVARLANAAGHEINNPLTVIITSLEMLAKDLEAGPVSPARIKPIVAAAERISDVIAHMRRMTRLETVSREPHLPEMLDLRESSDD